MKKAISLYVAVMFSVVVFAQDTTAGKNNFPPNNNRDTVPGNRSWNKNDSGFNSKAQWPKDSVNKKAWPNTDSTMQHSGNMKPDSTNTSYQAGGQASGTPDTSSANQHSTTTNTDNKASDATATLTDRVMMKDDQVIIVKNNESSPLDKSYKLESGVVVTKDGLVKYPGGKSVKLKNGQFIELTPATEINETKKATQKKTSSKSGTITKKKKTPNA